MADTATLEPETAESDSAASSTHVPAAPQTETARAQLESPDGPAPKGSEARARTRRRAVPALIHGTNAAGAAVGAAYSGAGPVGVAVLGVTGAVVGAALYGKSRTTARRAAAGGGSTSGGVGRRSGGHGGLGLRSGAGRAVAARNGSPGRGHRTGDREGSRGVGRGGSARGAAPTAKTARDGGGGRKPKSPKNGGGSGTGDTSKGSGAGRPGSIAKAAQSVKNAANKLRRQRAGTDPKSSDPTKPKSGSSSGHLRKLRRAVARKLLHYLRCTGAGLITGLVCVPLIPIGVLWGLLRLLRKTDALHAWRLPFRVAGRIWRWMYRRSRRRHDRHERAEQLNLDVNDPRKDDVPMSGALTTNTSVLNGKDSRFALAMAGCYASYIGYSPTGMMAVAAEYAGLPNAIRAAAAALRYLTLNCEQKYPCSPRTVAKLAESYEKLITAGARADTMVTLFRDVHAFDIQRLTDPRTNEQMWNVTPLNTNAMGQMFLPGRIESGCVLTMVYYRTFEPAHMLGVGCEVAGFGHGLNSLENAITALYQRTRDHYPVDDRVTGELAALATMTGAAAADAELAAKLFAADHAAEITNNHHPRKGPASESMWNAPRS